MADTAISKGTTTLILSESRKIFTQIAKERQATEIKAGIKYIYIEFGCLYVAMTQTLAKRPWIIDQFNAIGDRLLVIIDEAHIGTHSKLIEKFTNAYKIGFTATPDYKVAKHLPKLYKSIVIGPQPQELVEMGFLAPYFHYMRKGADLGNLAKDSRGEFTEASQFTAFDKPKVYDGLHEDLRRQSYKKAIIFCSSIKHCASVAADLRLQGYQVAEVHTANPMADQELASFTLGDAKICVSVGILTKGFDFPSIDLVILNRATTSLALYCQMIGRGSRIAPGKTRFTVLDYGGNAERHGLWNFEHDWQTKWNGKEKRKKDGMPPVKECPACFLMIPPKVAQCPECGHKFTKNEAELATGELVDMTDEYNRIRGKRIFDLTPTELAIYRRVTNKRQFALNVAKSQGEEFFRAFGKVVGFNPYHMKHYKQIPRNDQFNIVIK